jgi:hypothetical protein
VEPRWSLCTVYHTFLLHGNSLAVGVVVLCDVRDDGLHFEAGRVAHVVAGGETEGVGVAGLAVVGGVFSPTFRRERLPVSIVLPHLQKAGARIHAGTAISGAPGDVHVAALHHRFEGEGGRRGVANHAKVHAALAAYAVLQGHAVGAAGRVRPVKGVGVLVLVVLIQGGVVHPARAGRLGIRGLIQAAARVPRRHPHAELPATRAVVVRRVPAAIGVGAGLGDAVHAAQRRHGVYADGVRCRWVVCPRALQSRSPM